MRLKDLNLKSLIKIKVNYKQVGSDRINKCNKFVTNKKNNLYHSRFWYCNNF